MNKNNPRFSNNISIRNKKASYEYEFLDKYEAGMVLVGTEIKALREGKASVQEAYCFIKDDQVYVKGMSISQYTNSSFTNHELTRERKLLLHKSEIEKIRAKTEEKGLTIVPTKVYITARGFAKLEIAVARGKKLFDKRDSIKKKDQDRELSRMKF
ncbi:MAG: SsrA-binding protein [Marinoscillum sp.]|jgi:SsrA-binding protein